MADGMLYYLNLNLSIIYLNLSDLATSTKVSSHYFFCHKELHLRCCVGLELNFVT